jgi:hypothetical protein
LPFPRILPAILNGRRPLYSIFLSRDHSILSNIVLSIVNTSRIKKGPLVSIRMGSTAADLDQEELTVLVTGFGVSCLAHVRDAGWNWG